MYVVAHRTYFSNTKRKPPPAGFIKCVNERDILHFLLIDLITKLRFKIL